MSHKTMGQRQPKTCSRNDESVNKKARQSDRQFVARMAFIILPNRWSAIATSRTFNFAQQ
jgi:hypothetical protein